MVTVGVNLEGIKYRGWPIARYIEAEQRDPQLPAFARSYEHASAAELWFSRDAWQFASRPAIVEQHLGPEPPIRLDALSDSLWTQMLADAYDCLDPGRGRRARAKQIVTLTSGRKVEKDVSPHLQIKLVVRRSVHLDGLDEPFETAKVRLQPVRELVQRQSGA